MLRHLARHYDVDFKEERGKSLVTALVGSSIGSALGFAGASVVKVIPGIGTVLGVGSQAVLAGALTYAVGQVFNTHFQNDGSLIDFDTSKMRDKFKEFFSKGKEVAKMKEDSLKKDDVIANIERLHTLKEQGAITEDEYEFAKTELLQRL